MKYSEKDQPYIKAKSRVDKLKGFYTHFAVYLIVNSLIAGFKVARNLRIGESINDAIFDFSTMSSWMLWGVGLAIHGFAVFGLPKILGDNWEEEKIKQFMEEEKNNNFK